MNDIFFNAAPKQSVILLKRDIIFDRNIIEITILKSIEGFS